MLSWSLSSCGPASWWVSIFRRRAAAGRHCSRNQLRYKGATSRCKAADSISAGCWRLYSTSSTTSTPMFQRGLRCRRRQKTDYPPATRRLCGCTQSSRCTASSDFRHYNRRHCSSHRQRPDITWCACCGTALSLNARCWEYDLVQLRRQSYIKLQSMRPRLRRIQSTERPTLTRY